MKRDKGNASNKYSNVNNVINDVDNVNNVQIQILSYTNLVKNYTPAAKHEQPYSQRIVETADENPNS